MFLRGQCYPIRLPRGVVSFELTDKYIEITEKYKFNHKSILIKIQVSWSSGCCIKIINHSLARSIVKAHAPFKLLSPHSQFKNTLVYFLSLFPQIGAVFLDDTRSILVGRLCCLCKSLQSSCLLFEVLADATKLIYC